MGEQEAIVLLEKNYDGKCPTCKSGNIESHGIGHAMGNQPIKWQHTCKECNSIFYIIKND